MFECPDYIPAGSSYYMLVRKTDGEKLHATTSEREADEEAQNYADMDEDEVGVYRVDGVTGNGRLDNRFTPE